MTATGQQHDKRDHPSLLNAPPPRKSGRKQSLSLHPPGSALRRPEKCLSIGGVLGEQRTALSDLLQQLLKQRDQREQELRQVLVRKLFLSVPNSTPHSHCPFRVGIMHRKLEMWRGGTVSLRLWCTSRGRISPSRGELASVWVEKPEVWSQGVSIWWCSHSDS